MTAQARVLDALLGVVIARTHAALHTPAHDVIAKAAAEMRATEARRAYDAELSRWLGGNVTAFPAEGRSRNARIPETS